MEAWPISSGLQNWTGHRRTHCRPGKELALAGMKTMGVTLSHKKTNASVASGLREHRLLLNSHPVLIFFLSSTLEGVSCQCSGGGRVTGISKTMPCHSILLFFPLRQC